MAPPEIVTKESAKAGDAATPTLPIVIDAGKKRRKQIKQLREGRGKLMVTVSQLIDELKASGSISASAQPIVVVVRQKPRTAKLPWG